MECPAGTWIGAPLLRSSTGVPECTPATSGAAGSAVCTTTVVNPDATTTGSPFSVTNDEPSDVMSTLLAAVLYPLRPNTCLACPSNHYSPYPRAAAASHYNAACRCVHAVGPPPPRPHPQLLSMRTAMFTGRLPHSCKVRALYYTGLYTGPVVEPGLAKYRAWEPHGALPSKCSKCTASLSLCLRLRHVLRRPRVCSSVP